MSVPFMLSKIMASESLPNISQKLSKYSTGLTLQLASARVWGWRMRREFWNVKIGKYVWNRLSARGVLFLFHSRSKKDMSIDDNMTREVVNLIADDDAGHVRLIEKNLSRAGLHNPAKHFEN